MNQLKLAKLPDRVPVKLTIVLPPDLKRALDDYAVLYKAAYGEDEPVAELVPQMLQAFLSSDREFARAREKKHGG